MSSMIKIRKVNKILIVFKQTSWQILGKGLSSFSMIIILGLVTRQFGADGTGIFTLALTLLGFFYLAADFGVNAHVLPKFIGEDFKKEWQKLLGFRLVIATSLLVLIWLIALFWPGLNLLFRQSLFLGSLAVVASAIFSTTNAVFQSKLKYELAVVSSSINTIVALILIYFIVQLDLSLPFLLAAHALGWLVCAMLALWFVRKDIILLPIIELGYISKLLKDSWPISATLMLNLVYFRLDAFILTYFKTFTEVGIYNLAYSIFQTALVLPTFIMNSVYPIMLKSIQEDRKKFSSTLTSALFLVASLGFLGAIITPILSPWLINLIAPDVSFSGAVTSLNILSLGFPAFFVSAVLMWLYITLKRYKQMLAIYVIGLLFNTVLNLVFIPQYSYMAAAAGTVASEYLILILQIVILLRIRHSEKDLTMSSRA